MNARRGQGSGASLFSVGDRVRLLIAGRWVAAGVTGATFFGVQLNVTMRVGNHQLTRAHLVLNTELARRVRALGIVRNERMVS